MKARSYWTNIGSRCVGVKIQDCEKSDSVVQQTYEEMFMKINPLDAAAASKNKSKDVHLTNIDVNFGSNRILYVSHL